MGEIFCYKSQRNHRVSKMSYLVAAAAATAVCGGGGGIGID